MFFDPLMCVNARKFEYLRIIYELGKISSAVNVVLDSGLKMSGDTAKPADKSSTKMLQIHENLLQCKRCVWLTFTLCFADLKVYGRTGNEKRAPCFATLLQNELNSDFARFTTHESKLSCNKSRWEKVLQRVERSSTFWNKRRKLCVWHDSHVI